MEDCNRSIHKLRIKGVSDINFKAKQRLTSAMYRTNERRAGLRKGLYPITRFQRNVNATYGIAAPSLRNSGHMLIEERVVRQYGSIRIYAYLNTATLFTSAPHSNVNDPGEDPDIKRFRGRSGSRIVFSCTWNENRKNDIDDVRSAQGRIGRVGGVVCVVLALDAFQEPTIRFNTAGANPSAVKAAERRTSEACVKYARHFSTTFDAHHMFATLSSKIPRENGKMRTKGSRIDCNGANGGKNALNTT